jgi:ribosomal protein S18 acetylase RimI-like enzyme
VPVERPASARAYRAAKDSLAQDTPAAAPLLAKRREAAAGPGAAVSQARHCGHAFATPRHRGPVEPAMIVRDARPGELCAIGDLRVTAYTAQGSLTQESDYTETLRGLGQGGSGQVLAAVQGTEILGTVMLQMWPDAGHVVRGPGEAEIRALAVAPQAQGQGIGRTLLQAVTDLAISKGVRHLVLCTQREMSAAQHLYGVAGFQRLPDRDWCPVPGWTLLAYGRHLRAD